MLAQRLGFRAFCVPVPFTGKPLKKVFVVFFRSRFSRTENARESRGLSHESRITIHGPRLTHHTIRTSSGG
jgi:hypothetical protein